MGRNSNEIRQARKSPEYSRNRRIILATQQECWLCGGIVDKTLPQYHPGAKEVDHIIPLAMGGDKSDLSNLALSHRSCNNAKGGGLKSGKPTQRYRTVNKAASVSLENSGVDFLGVIEAEQNDCE